MSAVIGPGATSPGADVLYVHGDDADPAPPAVVRAVEAAGVALRSVAASEATRTLDARVAAGSVPLAILVEGGSSLPLHLVRHLRLVAPQVQAVFLTRPGAEVALRVDPPPPGLAGAHWTVVDPDGPALQRVVSDAVRSTRQRLRLRTTLHSMNVRLAAPEDGPSTPPPLVISNAFLASLLEHADDAIVAIDRADRIASWNRGAVATFGFERSEVVGAAVDVLVGAERARDLLSLVHDAWGGDAVRGVELECRREAGERFTAEVTLAPVRDGTGATVAVSLVARDVSERKRREARVRALNLQLEERLAAERSANAALTAALEALEAKEREIATLHDALGDT